MIKFSQGIEKSEPLCIAVGKVKWYSFCEKIVQQFLKKFNVPKKKKTYNLPYDPAVLLLFFFLFWSPHGIWSSQARDQIQVTAVT